MIFSDTWPYTAVRYHCFFWRKLTLPLPAVSFREFPKRHPWWSFSGPVSASWSFLSCSTCPSPLTETPSSRLLTIKTHSPGPMIHFQFLESQNYHRIWFQGWKNGSLSSPVPYLSLHPETGSLTESGPMSFGLHPPHYKSWNSIKLTWAGTTQNALHSSLSALPISPDSLSCYRQVTFSKKGEAIERVFNTHRVFSPWLHPSKNACKKVIRRVM